MITVLTLLAVLVLACGSERQPAAADTTTSQVGDLAPEAFMSLPRDVRADLETRACVVPQSYPDSVPHNVVRGRFYDRLHTDIAVLCLVRDSVMILVYRNEGADSVVVLASHPSSSYRQTGAGNQVEFSRALGVASADFIRSRRERFGGPALPPLDHDGLNDIFVGKASVVWYWHAGRWLQLQGSD